MKWNTVMVAADRLVALLAKIRSTGGIVTNCKPQSDGVRVTWMTPSS
jgi:hypothetical protein